MPSEPTNQPAGDGSCTGRPSVGKEDTRIAAGAEPVAITGVGLATSLGISADETWSAILAGKCGMGELRAMESQLPPGSVGGQVPDLPTDFEPDLPREIRYLRWTIVAALRDAGVLDALPAEPARCAFMLGTTLHGMRAGGRFIRTGDPAQLRDFLAGDTLRRATVGLGFGGQSVTTCSACSSSLGSVALAVTLLQAGQADLVVAGGYDTVSEYAWAGFNALRLIAPGPLRPFTRGRQGMKVGEGYGIVVLERATDAARRTARVRAIVAGWGESADAHHLTQPHPLGEGAAGAMTAALARADIGAPQLSLVAAHATGTPDNDAAEYAALARVLGQRLGHVPVVCYKSHLGHTLGGAGAAELILSTLAIRDGVVPACANIDREQVEFENLSVTTSGPVAKAVHYTLNTSLGFGGANTCVVLAPPARSDPSLPGSRAARPTAETNRSRPRLSREVWVTGIGVVLPGAVGNEQFIRRARGPGVPAWRQPPAALVESDYIHLLNARRVRRMSTYVKLSLAAATMATRDAGLEGRAELLARTDAILGTTHGSSGFSHEYYDQLVREGVAAANPVLFAEGVPNAGAAHLSLMLGLRGGCQTIIGTRTAGLDALRLAWLRIAGGAVDRAIVGGGEESQFAVEATYDACGLRSGGPSSAPFGPPTGFCTTAGAVALVLESADSARAGGRAPYARIDHAAAQSGDRELLPRTLARLLASSPAAPHVIGSADGTWIDRVELHALSRLASRPSVGSAYDAFGEAFSATPLVGIAAALLSGEMPALSAPPPSTSSEESSPRWAAPGDRLGTFTAVCTDWAGLATSVTLTPMERVPREW